MAIRTRNNLRENVLSIIGTNESQARGAPQHLRLNDRFLARASSTSCRKWRIIFSCSSVGHVPLSLQNSIRASQLSYRQEPQIFDVVYLTTKRRRERDRLPLLKAVLS
jgi:hypothetical protein